MEKTDLLERYYKAFIDIQKPRDFFIGMADYLEFVDSNPEFEGVMDSIFFEGKQKQQKLEELGLKATVVLEEMKDKIEDYIAKNEIKSEDVLKELKEYDDWKNGKIQDGSSITNKLYGYVGDVIVAINKFPEHLPFVTKFAKMVDVSGKLMVARLLPFQEYEDYNDLEEEIKRERETALWGQATQISELYWALKRGREEYKKLVGEYKENPSIKISWLLMNYSVLIGEWIGVEEEKQQNLVFFRVEKAKPWLVRIHNFIVSRSFLNRPPEKIIKIESEVSKPAEQIKIKKITLRQDDLMLEINGGKKIISFKARKSKGESEETKFFKIIYHLWDYRQEIGKNGKVTKQGEWVTLKNLATGAESTEGATTRNVSRLRDIFKTEGVPIQIEPSNNSRYKLIIQFG